MNEYINNCIHENVIQGKKLMLGLGVVIGGPAEHREKYYTCKMGNVIIGDNVLINNFVTIDSGIERATQIGDYCFIMAKAHVGHDAILEDYVTLSPGAVIGGHAEIGERTTIGINASIHQRVKVPQGCMIGAGAFIGLKAKLLPYRKYVGVGRDIGDNVKEIERAGLTPEDLIIVRLNWVKEKK